MENHNTNGWVEYKERVLFQLTELGKKTDSIEVKLDALKEDVTVLKTNAKFYGAAAGIIAGIVVTISVNLIFMLLTHGKIV